MCVRVQIIDSDGSGEIDGVCVCVSSIFVFFFARTLTKQMRNYADVCMYERMQHACRHASTYARKYVHVCRCMYVWMCVRVCVCVCVCQLRSLW